MTDSLTQRLEVYCVLNMVCGPSNICDPKKLPTMYGRVILRSFDLHITLISGLSSGLLSRKCHREGRLTDYHSLPLTWSVGLISLPFFIDRAGFYN